MNNPSFPTLLAVCACLCVLLQERAQAQQAERLTTVSSEFEEREPTLSHDGQTLYFWRRNTPHNTAGFNDNGDAWYSRRQPNGNFGPPQPMNWLNTPGQEFVLQESRKGDTLWICQIQTGIPLPPDRNHGLKYCLRMPGGWSRPQPARILNLNFRGDRKDYYITPQGHLLLTNFGTDSRGGVDLYISFRINDSTWGPPLNFGPDVNSPFEEDAPFMLPDGRTLVFNSNGHNNERQHEIYTSRRLDDSWRNWSKPEPVGFPVNQKGYDFDPFMSADGEWLYWASDYETQGGYDLFRYNLRSCGATVTPGGDLARCAGDSITLTAGFAWGKNVSYQWQKDGIDIPGATQRQLNVTQSGLYRLLQVKDNCRDLSPPQNIRFVPVPDPVLVADKNTICRQDSVKLSVSNTQAQYWTWYKNGLEIPGEHRPTLWVKRHGTYWVEARNGDCGRSSRPVRINRMDNPLVYLINAEDLRVRPLPSEWLWASGFGRKKEKNALLDMGSDPNGSTAIIALSASGKHYTEVIRAFSPDGSLRWEQRGAQRAKPDAGRFIQMDIEGNVLIGGGEGFVRKYHANGVLAWEIEQQHAAFKGITSDPLGHVYALAQYRDTLRIGEKNYAPNARGSYFLAKYDPWGKLIWVKTYSTEPWPYDFGNALHCDEMGNVYVSGGFLNVANFGKDRVLHASFRAENFFTAKYLPGGDVQWCVKFDPEPPAGDAPRTAAAFTDADGASFMIFNGRLVKYDHNGRLQWKSYVKAPGVQLPQSLRIASDRMGTLFTFGLTTHNQYYLSRTDRRGTSLPVWSGAATPGAAPLRPAISANEEGKLFIAGFSQAKTPAKQDTEGFPAFVSCFGPPDAGAPSNAVAICPGETVTLLARTPPGLPFYWLRDGAPIAGATDTLLQVSQAGKYQVRVFSSACESLSNVQRVEDCYQSLVSKPKAPEAPPSAPVSAALPPKTEQPQPVIEPAPKVPNKLETTRSGIPTRLNERRVRRQNSVTVAGRELRLEVWDHGAVDNDTISLSFNGTWLLQEYALSKKPKEFRITLDPNISDNHLILYAHNLGAVPPNTLSISIFDGRTRRVLKLESDLNYCGSIRLRYSP